MVETFSQRMESFAVKASSKAGLFTRIRFMATSESPGMNRTHIGMGGWGRRWGYLAAAAVGAVAGSLGSLVSLVLSVLVVVLLMVLTQGGIGAYPIAIQHVLSLYLINDIVSLSYGWISWSAQTVSVIIGGVLSLIFLSMKIKKAI